MLKDILYIRSSVNLLAKFVDALAIVQRTPLYSSWYRLFPVFKNKVHCHCGTAHEKAEYGRDCKMLAYPDVSTECLNTFLDNLKVTKETLHISLFHHFEDNISV
jgi:hypothetical protein